MKESRTAERARLWAQKTGCLWIGLLLLALAFRGVQWPVVAQALAEANYGLLLLAPVTVVATILAKTARWRLLFQTAHRPPGYSQLFTALVIGQMVNLAVPARLGELARAYCLGSESDRSPILVRGVPGHGLAFILGTIAVEKLVDVTMLVLLLLSLLPMMALPRWMQEPGRAVVVSAVLLLVTALVLARSKEQAVAGVNHLLRRLPKRVHGRVVSQVEMALDSLDILCHRHVSLGVWGWSALIWFLAASTNYVTFLAMGIDLPLSAAAFLLVVLHIGIAVPSTPGKIGVFHYLCRLGLSVFAVDRSLALGYSLVLYFVVFAPPALSGAFLLWRVTGEQSTSPCRAP